jgi:oligoendopeptidase F
MSLRSELPASPDAFADATWETVAPYYERLATCDLKESNVEEWLVAWSTLDEMLGEAGTKAMIAYSADTRIAEREAAYLRFFSEIFPKANEQEVRLARRLLDLGYSRPDLEHAIREFRTDAEIFREENVPLFAQLEEMDASYQKITGGLTVDWNGEQKTVPQLQPYLKSQDRALREKAFRLGAGAYLEKQEEMAALFDQMFELRQRVARNAGFANFQDYTFIAKHRFDYTPDDCRKFHDAVEETVVPAAERQLAYRRERLAVDSVRPWDTNVDTESTEPLKPFEEVDTFIDRARRIFGKVDPELGRFFDVMADEGLLDLENRAGKAPGGYCTKLSYSRKPFIFMNAVGVPDDVNTLVHEAGHAFHAFLASSHPLIWQRSVGSESAELASMSMELLAAPHLAAPTGYYDEGDVRRAWIEHLEDVLLSLTHIASVDAFQSWIYTSGEGGDASARDRAWLRIRARFEKGIDWSGLERERVSRWYRQLHIFQYPFYYIEYGIAQLGALQVWRESIKDQALAVRRYKEALALGGTRSLPEMYQAAGAALVFDAGTMKQLVTLVEERLSELRAETALPAGRSSH